MSTSRSLPEPGSRDPVGILFLGTALTVGLIAGGSAAAITSLASAIIGWAFLKFGGGEYTGFRLFGAALATRNAALLAVPLLAGGRTSPIFGDEAQYAMLSLKAADLLFGRHHTLPEEIASVAVPAELRRFSDDGFAYLLSPLAAVHGGEGTLPAIRSAAALAGALAVCAAWWAGSKIVGRRAGRRAAAVYAIFPTSVFWSSTALKESVASALVLVGLGMVAELSTGKRHTRWPAWAASLWAVWFLLLSIREHLMFVAGALAVPAAALLAWPSSGRTGLGRAVSSVAASALVFLMATTALWASGYGVFGKDVLDSLDPRFLEERAEMEARGAATLAPETPAPSPTPQDGAPQEGHESSGSRLVRLAKRFPETAFSVAFRPYPWEVPRGSLGRFADPARLFLFPSQIAWYAVLFMGILGGSRLLVRHPRHALWLLGFPLVIFVFYGLTQANLGTAFRMREVFVPIVLLAAAVPRRRHTPTPEPSVALVLPTLGPGGTENYIVGLVRLLRERGHHASLFVLAPPTEKHPGLDLPWSDDAAPRYAGRRCRYDLGLPIRLARIMGTPDCCSTHLFAGNFWGGLASRISGAALLSTFQTTHPRSRIQRMLEPLVLGELVICNSEAVAGAVRRRGIPPRRIRVIRNGVNVEAVRRAVTRDREAVLRGIGVPTDAFVACLPARFDPLKDQLTAVEAFVRSRLARRGAFLVLTGSSMLVDERKYREKVEAAAAGLQGIVILDFYRPLPELISASDVVVLSSLHEGLPNVLLEAGALGKPSIATAVGGSPEVIAEKETGMLVPPRDPEALAGALEKLAYDPELKRRMGEAARCRIESEFGIDGVVERFLESTAECVSVASKWDAPDTARLEQ